MDEPEFLNHSPHEAQLLPLLDRDGAEARLVLVKAAFGLLPGGGLRALRALDEPRGFRWGDEPWGAPEVADLRLPADLGLPKPGTDVLLCGHAVPPPGLVAAHLDVGLRVADRAKLLRVHGRREWRRGIGSVVPGPAEAVARTPLAWSRAWGGADFSDPSRPVEEPRNPVGSGVARSTDSLIGRPAPQIEAPDDPITRANGRYVPVGCAPLGRHFEPRRALAGTYDQAWLQDRYPGRPDDYRAEHEHCAAPDLVFSEPLRGGEPVRVVGVHAAGAVDLVLPKWLVRIDATVDGRQEEVRPHLDTVVIDSDAMVVELVWRALFRRPARKGRFTAVKVTAKEFLG